MREAMMMRTEDAKMKVIVLEQYEEEMVALEKQLGPLNVPAEYEEKLSALEKRSTSLY